MTLCLKIHCKILFVLICAAFFKAPAKVPQRPAAAAAAVVNTAPAPIDTSDAGGSLGLLEHVSSEYRIDHPCLWLSCASIGWGYVDNSLLDIWGYILIIICRICEYLYNFLSSQYSQRWPLSDRCMQSVCPCLYTQTWPMRDRLFAICVHVCLHRSGL